MGIDELFFGIIGVLIGFSLVTFVDGVVFGKLAGVLLINRMMTRYYFLLLSGFGLLFMTGNYLGLIIEKLLQLLFIVHGRSFIFDFWVRLL